MKLSIIINNYNYASFLHQCISSALEQTEHAHEIIVVDDGSTDNSIKIIEQFSALIPIIQPNGGQAAAMNSGFQASTGSLILFLDADDFLEPNAVEEIQKAWRNDYAKLQFRLNLVNVKSNIIGELPMQSMALPFGDQLEKLISDGRYGSMPTSGNVYRRSALEFIMPIPEDEYRISADLFINTKIVRFGSVGAIEKKLGAYRLHGQNLFQTGSLITVNHNRLVNRVRAHLQKCQLVTQEAKLAGRSMQSELLFPIPACIDRIIAYRLGLQEQTGDTASCTVLLKDLKASLTQGQSRSTALKWGAICLATILCHCPIRLLPYLAWAESVTPTAFKRIPSRLLGVDF